MPHLVAAAVPGSASTAPGFTYSVSSFAYYAGARRYLTS